MIRVIHSLAQQSDEEIIFAICGGDGSLARCISDLKKEPYINKNMQRITFTLLPYGTGNDLAQSFGWGCEEGSWAASIPDLALALVNAKRREFAMWDIVFAADLYSHDGKLVHSTRETQGKLHRIAMACYFNLGICAEIGAYFEKKRTNERLLNKVLYGISGVVKAVQIR